MDSQKPMVPKSRIGPAINKIGGKKISDISIYTMPQNFQPPKQDNAKEAKSTGLLILIIGSIVLIGGFVGAYFYLNKDKAPVEEKLIEARTTLVKPEVKKPTNPVAPPSPPARPTPPKTDPNTADTSKTEKPDEGETNNGAQNENPVPVEINNTPATSTTSTSTEGNIVDPLKVSTTTEPAITDKQADSDSDGIFDAEEEMLGLNKYNSDSDGDGYDDRAELLGGYNPMGDGKISENSNVKIYSNEKFGYGVVYPISSTLNIITDESIMFTFASGDFIQIIVQPGLPTETLEDWYLGQFKVPPTELIGSENWQAVKSANGQVIYLTPNDSDNIFTLNYDSEVGATLNYPNIFEMMFVSITSSF